MADVGEAVVVTEDVLDRYVAFTRFNSPYPAHDRGHAIDLYPEAGAPSPVSGQVVRTLTVRAPDRPYAVDHDHLVVVDDGERLARILHVDPAVEAGERVEVGDSLGTLVRSGYFAPWVDNHVHLGFRPREADPIRAGGSLPVEVPVDVEPVPWDGSGRVVERGDTYVVLDAPGHPSPGDGFAGIASDDGRVVDGGLPHYDGGGVVGDRQDGDPGPVTLLGQTVGTAEGDAVDWLDAEILANGTPVTGLSLACYRDRLGAKLVSWEGIPAEVGDHVEVEVRGGGSGNC